MAYDKQRVGRRLKSLRVDKGWEQSDLAERSGVPVGTISSAEAARSGMNLDTAYKLTGALGCSLETLVCRDGERDESMYARG